MCDSSYDDTLERYRRNNVELAVALNELKVDMSIIQNELLQRNSELQQVYAENVTLKQELLKKDNQISTWRALIMDLVQTNTKKYSELVKNIGLVAAASTTNKPNVCHTSMKTTENTLPTTSMTVEQNDGTNIAQRRQKDNGNDNSQRLADLTEESILSQLNESNSFNESPQKRISHVVSRRRASIASIPAATSTPPSSPLRPLGERMVANGETKGKKPTAKVKKMSEIIDENTPINGAAGRPTRKTAPRNLSEPKLSTKLRRN